MARIRTIKPEFFQHEQLQDLETAHPGAHVMLVFAGLWGHCDKAGVFAWSPRTLKLGILPFLAFDLTATLQILVDADLVRQFTVEGKTYGVIPTFRDHQRITGREAQEPARYPDPPAIGSSADTSRNHHGHTADDRVDVDAYDASDLQDHQRDRSPETIGNRQGNIADTPRTTGREGKGREGNGVCPRVSRLIDGAAQREHGTHAWCAVEPDATGEPGYRIGLCVPAFVHRDLVSRLAGADAEARLRAWYPTVLAGVRGQTVALEAPKFWRQAFAAWQAGESDAASPTRAVPSAADTRRYLASVYGEPSA